MNSDGRRFLKHHTEALVKDVGVETACAITGKSKATIGRYYSLHEEHAERFMPVDAVAQLEKEASYPHVTAALAEMAGLSISRNTSNAPASRHVGHVNEDIAVISQRFAMLMSAYADAIADNVITPAEARSMLSETLELQKVLVEMKLHLEVHSET
ncbi:hypothetical protein [Jannaschia pohangensis]|uniref:Phage regulatory protein CII (CP76) n=1 Tax=Jannaschia pohangensis TaxID=390807 RepID=A0A1I3JJ47_9RHOB|nr:hypothetical protein [Jannaschia pohangensis]SFI60283.1 hypothetical protein SAMN04488095_1339 [Jannaschia pohangensis]